ncbi:MAG: sel1 repeat family protein [Candidatus Paracaedibacteraceae bacterium]|nr:sel1 repeat family protein [Candidatus Paracaedibacteraceae bacterium]
MNIKRIIKFLITSLTSIAIGFLLGQSFERFVDEIGWSDALHVYRMDAEHGNAEAQYYVGLYTLEGKGAKRDDTEAFH